MADKNNKNEEAKTYYKVGVSFKTLVEGSGVIEAPTPEQAEAKVKDIYDAEGIEELQITEITELTEEEQENLVEYINMVDDEETPEDTTPPTIH